MSTKIYDILIKSAFIDLNKTLYYKLFFIYTWNNCCPTKNKEGEIQRGE
jgi:hypothetical protein